MYSLSIQWFSACCACVRDARTRVCVHKYEFYKCRRGKNHSWYKSRFCGRNLWYQKIKSNFFFSVSLYSFSLFVIHCLFLYLSIYLSIAHCFTISYDRCEFVFNFIIFKYFPNGLYLRLYWMHHEYVYCNWEKKTTYTYY